MSHLNRAYYRMDRTHSTAVSAIWCKSNFRSSNLTFALPLECATAFSLLLPLCLAVFNKVLSLDMVPNAEFLCLLRRAQSGERMHWRRVQVSQRHIAVMKPKSLLLLGANISTNSHWQSNRALVICTWPNRDANLKWDQITANTMNSVSSHCLPPAKFHTPILLNAFVNIKL